jgi:hypothetical protein
LADSVETPSKNRNLDENTSKTLSFGATRQWKNWKKKRTSVTNVIYTLRHFFSLLYENSKILSIYAVNGDSGIQRIK